MEVAFCVHTLDGLHEAMAARWPSHC
jgi:hypothetical protein